MIRMLIVVLIASTAWRARPAPGVQKAGAISLESIPDPAKVAYDTFGPDGNFSGSGWYRGGEIDFVRRSLGEGGTHTPLADPRILGRPPAFRYLM